MKEKTTPKDTRPANGEPLTLDYNNVTADALGEAYGLSLAEIADMRKHLASAF